MSIIRTTIILFASILTTLCVALFLILTTPAGLTFLERNINTLQSSAVISGLRGSLLGQFSIDKLTLADTNGTWLTVSEAKVQWSPKELLRDTLHISLIRVHSLDLSRLPEGADTPEEKQATSGEPPSFLPGLILDELRIEKILLGAVSEPPIPELTLSGSANLASPSGPGRVELHLHPLDRTHPELDLLARLEENTLECSGTFNDPTGNMVAFLAGLPTPQPLHLSFQGSGTAGSYQGDISLQARELASSKLHMKWNGHENTGSATGQVRIDPAGTLGEVASWTGEVLDLRVRAHSGPHGRHVKSDLDLSSSLFKLSAAAGIDLQEMITDTTFSLTHLDPARLAEQTGVLLEQPGPLSGTVTGPLSGPILSCSLHARSLNSGTLRIKHPEITLNATPVKIEEQPEYSATLLTTAKDVVLPDILHMGPFRVQTVLEGLGTQTMQTRMHASANGLDIKGTASLTPKAGTLTTELAGSLSPGAFLASGIGPVPETLDLSGSLVGNITATDLNTNINVEIGRFPEAPAPLNDLLGPKSTLALSARLKDSQVLLDSISLKGKGMSTDGTGSYMLDSGKYRAELSGKVQGAALSPDMAHLGKIDLTAQASGTDKQVALSARVTPESGPVFGLPLTVVKLDSELQELDTAPFGQWRLKIGTEPGPLTAAGDLNLADGLSITRGTLDGLDLQGTFKVDIPSEIPRREVRFQLESTALESAAALVDQPLRGGLKLKGTYVETGNSAVLDLSGTGKNLGYGDTLSVAGLDLSKLTLNPAAPEQPDLDLSLKDVVAGALVLDRVKLHTEGGTQGLNFSLTGEGRKPAPLLLSLSGRTSREKDGRTVRLETLRGEYNSFPVKLLEPTELRLKDGLPNLSPATLVLGDGTFGIRGGLSESAVQGEADLQGLSLASLQLLTSTPLPGGKVNATASLSGPPEKPKLVTRVRIEDLAPVQAEPENTIIGTLDITAGTTPDGLEIRGSLDGLGADPLAVSGDIPFILSLQPFRAELPENSPMQVSSRGEVDLTRISDLLDLPDLDLAGKLRLDVSAKGTMATPDLAGEIALEGGRAEYVRTGTVLEQMQARVLLDGDRVNLKQFSATDGDKGTLLAAGTVTLPLRSPLSYNLTADMKDARLLSTDMVTAHVGGTGRIQGDATQTTVQADLTVPRGEVNISRNPDPSLVPVPVREINVDDGDRIEEPAQTPPPADLTLDVGVRIPGRLYVRGRGLDSEWKGNLKVTGTAEKPVVRGKLESVRGTLAFAGRDMQLKTSAVTLSGAVPPNPLLNIVTSTPIKSTEAQLKIQGSARNPELVMESVPALPEDEVLSLLLFGDAVARLTPMQALQLANTARTLAGSSGKGGFDPMGFTRSLLGLDDIKVGSAEEGGMQVGLGKYLTDDIYVELEKGLTSDKDTLSVEMEVTPHIEVETEVGTDSSGKVGVNWKWEY